MKITTIGLSALLGTFGSLVAIERPTGKQVREEIPARPAEPRGGILGSPKEEEMSEKAPLIQRSAYLGVGGELPGAALLMHLDLKSGLLLTTIDPTSPAGLVGLRENDIIEEVDGQKLTDQDSLREVLLAKVPGDVVLLKLIRGGKSMNQKVTLGETQVRQRIQPRALVPRRGADMKELLGGQLGNVLGGFGNADLQKELVERLEKALGDQGSGFEQLRFNLSADLLNGEDMKLGGGIGSMRLEDEEGSIEMKMQAGKRELVIRDKEGKLLFNGPYDSDVDKAAVPAEYRARVERLDTGTGTGNQNSFQLELNGKKLFEKSKSKTGE